MSEQNNSLFFLQNFSVVLVFRFFYFVCSVCIFAIISAPPGFGFGSSFSLSNVVFFSLEIFFSSFENFPFSVVSSLRNKKIVFISKNNEPRGQFILLLDNDEHERGVQKKQNTE